ncbi:MAG: Jag N-terminal domain-containing protein [Helicobacteraceae bacterium]|jgi:spoIIIJ-associated protein|nr:Jag N-terminal domain-containing protein [Helicobacteraceae bacterium]
MIKVEEKTLHEAIIKASQELGCSIEELEYEVISEGSSGFMGFMNKPAVIVAHKKSSAHTGTPQYAQRDRETPREAPRETPRETPREIPADRDRPRSYEKPREIREERAPNAPKEPPYDRKEPPYDRYEKPVLKPSASDRLIQGAFSDDDHGEPLKVGTNFLRPNNDHRADSAGFSGAPGGNFTDRYEPRKAPPRYENREPRPYEPIKEARKAAENFDAPREKPRAETKFDAPREEKPRNYNYDQPKRDIFDTQRPVIIHTPEEEKRVCEEIAQILRNLFDNTDYKISEIEVTPYDDKTLQVFFDGEDAALLIGKDGYRYKALSYILFNWINPTYGYLLRLEIAKFLQNQEEMIARYLEPIIEQIRETGKGQTRVLDGVLVQIALKLLREKFPDKYVGIKTTQEGDGKFVVVNEFIKKSVY